jgi:hypothetical protein
MTSPIPISVSLKGEIPWGAAVVVVVMVCITCAVIALLVSDKPIPRALAKKLDVVPPEPPLLEGQEPALGVEVHHAVEASPRVALDVERRVPEPVDIGVLGELVPGEGPVERVVEWKVEPLFLRCEDRVVMDQVPSEVEDHSEGDLVAGACREGLVDQVTLGQAVPDRGE